MGVLITGDNGDRRISRLPGGNVAPSQQSLWSTHLNFQNSCKGGRLKLLGLAGIIEVQCQPLKENHSNVSSARHTVICSGEKPKAKTGDLGEKREMTLLGDQVGQGDVCKSNIAERIADQEETFYGSVAFILSKDDYHEGRV